LISRSVVQRITQDEPPAQQRKQRILHPHPIDTDLDVVEDDRLAVRVLDAGVLDMDVHMRRGPLANPADVAWWTLLPPAHMHRIPPQEMPMSDDEQLQILAQRFMAELIQPDDTTDMLGARARLAFAAAREFLHEARNQHGTAVVVAPNRPAVQAQLDARNQRRLPIPPGTRPT